MIVSKLLPTVSIVAFPEPAAVKLNQIEAVPGDGNCESVEWLGSPTSRVALVVLPVVVPLVPLMVVALAKLSFAGGVGIISVAVTALATWVQSAAVMPSTPTTLAHPWFSALPSAA